MEQKIIEVKRGFLSQQEGDFLIVSTEKGSEFCVLNEMAQFIFENCNGLTCEQLVNKIFEACVDKEHLSKENIMDDCKEVLDTLERKGLIICRRSNV